MGSVNPKPIPHISEPVLSIFFNSALSLPKFAVRTIFGKRAALATPIFALAAIIICSASLISGRDSKSDEGILAGGIGGVIRAFNLFSGIFKFISPDKRIS